MEQDSLSILSEQKEKKIKVILIGDQAVGKSKLMETMLNIESKVNDKQIQSVDFFISRVLLPDKTTQKIYVWITSGEIKNMQSINISSAMIRAFLIQSHIYIIAFSLNNAASFENALSTWFSQCAQNSKQMNAYYLFLGTMGDLERKCPSYEDIIKAISQKCVDLNVQGVNSKNNAPLKGIRQTEKLSKDQIVLYAQSRLPPNVYYSETSATSAGNQGLERSMELFTQLIIQANKSQDEIYGSSKIAEVVSDRKPSAQVQTQQKRPSSKIEIQQQQPDKQEKMCCKIF